MSLWLELFSYTGQVVQSKTREEVPIFSIQAFKNTWEALTTLRAASAMVILTVCLVIDGADFNRAV